MTDTRSTAYVLNCILIGQLHEGPTEYIDSSYSSLLHIALTEDVG